MSMLKKKDKDGNVVKNFSKPPSAEYMRDGGKVTKKAMPKKVMGGKMKRGC